MISANVISDERARAIKKGRAFDIDGLELVYYRAAENIDESLSGMNKLNYEGMGLEKLELFGKRVEERYFLIISEILNKIDQRKDERKKEFEENFKLRESLIQDELKYIYEYEGLGAGDKIKNKIEKLRKKYNNGSDKAKKAFYFHAERVIRVRLNLNDYLSVDRKIFGIHGR